MATLRVLPQDLQFLVPRLRMAVELNTLHFCPRTTDNMHVGRKCRRRNGSPRVQLSPRPFFPVLAPNGAKSVKIVELSRQSRFRRSLKLSPCVARAVAALSLSGTKREEGKVAVAAKLYFVRATWSDRSGTHARASKAFHMFCPLLCEWRLFIVSL